jgi:serine phosphatase RsbU (regulator of sigma subunit)
LPHGYRGAVSGDRSSSTDLLDAFADRYAASLRRHVDDPGEHGLVAAYELGCRALEDGRSMLELVALHLAVRRSIVAELGADRLADMDAFLSEALAAFEIAQRSVVEAHRAAAEAHGRLEWLQRMSKAYLAIASRPTLDERIAEACAQAAALLDAADARVTTGEAASRADEMTAELAGGVGRLVVTARAGREWTEADRLSLHGLALLIGGPIVDSRRLELAQRIPRLRAVLGRAVEPSDVLTAFRGAGIEVVGADAAVVRLDDRSGGGVDWPAGPLPAIERVAATGVSQYVDGGGTDCRTWAVLPVGARGESIGVVALGYRDQQPFDTVQRSFLEQVAQLLGYLVDQSAAYAREHEARATAERTSGQLHRLHRFASELTTADTSGRVADILVGRLVEVTGAIGGAVVGTVRPPGVEVLAAVGLAESAVDAITAIDALVPGSDPRSVERPVIRVADLPSDVGAPLSAAGIDTIVAYQVPSAAGPIGFVALTWSHEPPGDQAGDDVAGLITMAVPSLARAARFDVEHRIAETLQRSLLEVPPVAVAGVRWSARYRPGSEGVAGGDWYDLIELDQHRLAIAVGDIVGRGVHAAAAMGQVRSATRALAHQIADPAQLLEALDDLAMRTGRGQYSSLVYVVADMVAGELRHAAAGHPPPVLRRGDDGSIVLTDGRGPLLGVACSRRTAVEAMRPGGSLVLYTDGLVGAQTRNIDDGIRRLVDVLDAVDLAGGPEQVTETLMSELLPAHDAGSDGRDDVAVVVVELTERGETEPS